MANPIMKANFRKNLSRNGIIKEGHFLLSSGRHSDLYINKDAIYCNPALFQSVVSMMIYYLNNYSYIYELDIITGPAIAGAVLAAPIALQLQKTFIYPEKVIDHHEKENVRMELRRGYNKVVKGKKVWIVEDIITTGKSVENTIDAITFNDGIVAGVSAIWNRGNYYPSMGLFFPIIEEVVYSYPAHDCPKCKQGIPVQDPKE